jgi:hypothetical protein
MNEFKRFLKKQSARKWTGMPFAACGSHASPYEHGNDAWQFHNARVFLDDVISQKMIIIIVTAVETSNLTYVTYC